MKILGISAFYHDAAAALVVDGEIVAAAQEERFTRKKHDESLPKNAVDYCLKEAGITLQDVDIVSFYDKPLIKFERLLQTYLAYAPGGLSSFAMAIPIWFTEKMFIEKTIRKELGFSGEVLFSRHHISHAASAFYPSPFDEAAVVCVDGVGEWSTTTVSHGKNNQLTMLKEIQFPHSLGLLYSAFTYYTGFKVNSGEYKVMGLAPYGEPKYVQIILDNLIDLKEDGSFRMNMKYFTYPYGLRMTGSAMSALFGGPPRKPEDTLTQREMDLAASIQAVIEIAMDKIARAARKMTGSPNLCLAGGVALNCVANGKILRSGIFDNIWIQPAAGDAGGALGTALDVWHQAKGNPRPTMTAGLLDRQKGSYLGPEITEEEILQLLKEENIPAQKYDDDDQLTDAVGEILANENVIGWVSGRMEFGPRSLGGRSILGDARSPKMQSIMNLKIKYRESFRPFAPSVLKEKVSEWFELEGDSPYMLLVAPVKEDKRLPLPENFDELFGIDKLNVPRSQIPAVTHVDFSARVQTVHKETNPRYHKLISAFEKKTGCPVLVNTSFNVRGEPIVCTARDAYRCFLRTEMDYLVLGNYVLDKKLMPNVPKDKSWMKEFALD